MGKTRDWTYQGHGGALAARAWPNPDARYIALLCHGYGEHAGRYAWLAERLVEHGAVVHAVDHRGHGRSAGDRVLIPDFEPVVDDFHLLAEHTAASHPGLPVVLIGHSMGGMIAARYAQRFGTELAAVVLSGPVLGRYDAANALLTMDEIPDIPIDPAVLSRDPAVGADYAADPLVWHGPFRRATLQAMVDFLATITADGSLGELPTLWIHGEQDQLVPLDGTREGMVTLRGGVFTSRIFPGARHEVFNETNRVEVLATVTRFIDGVLGC